MGHLINPFSLHSGHLIWSRSSPSPSPSAITLQLPLQLTHSKNFMPPQPLHGELLVGESGIPSNSFFSFPCSCNPTTSSAPPMCLPLMKSLGGTTRPPIILHSSSLNSMCIDTSLSWNNTRKLSNRNRMALQSSNVFLIPLKLVV